MPAGVDTTLMRAQHKRRKNVKKSKDTEVVEKQTNEVVVVPGPNGTLSTMDGGVYHTDIAQNIENIHQCFTTGETPTAVEEVEQNEAPHFHSTILYQNIPPTAPNQLLNDDASNTSSFFSSDEIQDINLHSELNSSMEDISSLHESEDRSVDNLSSTWRSRLLQKISYLPIFEEVFFSAQNIYDTGKSYNSFTASSCQKFETSASLIYKTAQPLLDKVSGASSWKYVDEFGCEQFERLENAFPLIKCSSTQVLDQGKSYLHDVSSKFVVTSPAFYRQQFLHFLQNRLMSIMESSEQAVEKYLSPNDSIISTSEQSLLERLKHLSSQIQKGSMVKASIGWEKTASRIQSLKSFLDELGSSSTEDKLKSLVAIADIDSIIFRYRSLVSLINEYTKNLQSSQMAQEVLRDITLWGKTSANHISEESREMRIKMENILNRSLESCTELREKLQAMIEDSNTSQNHEEGQEEDEDNNTFFHFEVKSLLRKAIHQFNFLKSLSESYLGNKSPESDHFQTSGVYYVSDYGISEEKCNSELADN